LGFAHLLQSRHPKPSCGRIALGVEKTPRRGVWALVVRVAGTLGEAEIFSCQL